MVPLMAETSPEQGRDYYVLPDGRWVFTARYHLARGECCRSGCRNCPYGYRPQTTTAELLIARDRPEREPRNDE